MIPSFARLRSRPRARGAVLAVVLVVLVVMMLGSLSLLRSLDTSTLLSGNLAFKRDSVNRAGIALNQAFQWINNKKAAKDEAGNDVKFKAVAESSAGCYVAAKGTAVCTQAPMWKKMNYWPRLLEADGNGVPLVLKDADAFDKIFTNSDNRLAANDNAGFTIRFLIERMCTDYGSADEKKCSLAENMPVGGDQRNPGQLSDKLALYRITVRTDGPRNTQTYTQAITSTRIR